MKSLKNGDYVLGTKYNDGDPGDHFAVGFFGGKNKFPHDERFQVLDSEGKSFRINGFRRVERITKEAGEFIARQGENLEKFSPWSVWRFARNSSLRKVWSKAYPNNPQTQGTK